MGGRDGDVCVWVYLYGKGKEGEGKVELLVLLTDERVLVDGWMGSRWSKGIGKVDRQTHNKDFTCA